MQRFILSQFFQKITEVIITYEDSGSHFIDVPGRFLVFQKPPDDVFHGISANATLNGLKKKSGVHTRRRDGIEYLFASILDEIVLLRNKCICIFGLTFRFIRVNEIAN